MCLTNLSFMSSVAVVINVGEIMANRGGKKATHKVLYQIMNTCPRWEQVKKDCLG